MKAAAILLAGGTGARVGGGVPKQLRLLGGKPVLQWSLNVFLAHPAVDQVVLVVPGELLAQFSRLAAESGVRIVGGGASRTASVLAGLAALTVEADTPVLIHDAARPGLDAGMVSALLAAFNGFDASAPALPMSDAVKRREGGALSDVSRSDLYRVQTPQVFRTGAILQALAASNGDLVDDLAAIEAVGGTVNLIAGDERLHKITYASEFELLEAILTPSHMKMPRIGKGFDVHAFGPGDRVTLCGVAVPHDKALSGHSDADVAWHALTDAILGAVALGDIGDHFPPSDPQWRGAASEVFLAHAVGLAREAGFAMASCDLTIICEAPKVGPHREAMRKETARVLRLSLDAVSVKATTTERLGFTGRGEGIAAEALAVLRAV